MSKKDGMYCYYDWVKPLKKVPTEDFKQLFIAMLEYHQNGTEPPEFDGVTGMAADFIFPQIERSKKYAENGAKGGLVTQSKSVGSTVAKTDGSTLKHKLKHKTKTNTKTNTDTMCVSPLETSEEGAAKPQHTKKRFEKPSLEDIRAYCQERNNSVDPEKFFDFYESKGRMIGKNRMKDWKSAVRNWERKEQTEIPRQKKSDVKPDSELTEEDKEFAKWWAENLGGG